MLCRHRRQPPGSVPKVCCFQGFFVNVQCFRAKSRSQFTLPYVFHFQLTSKVVSPRGSDPGKGPKPAATQPAPALPLNSFNATGKDKKAQLSPEQVADVRADLSDAMGNVGKLRRQKTAGEGAADALASEPVKPSTTTKPKTPRGTFARKAAQALLDSLATPATKPNESKVNKGKGESGRGRPVTKAKAKAKAKVTSSGSKPSKGAVPKKAVVKTTTKAAAKKARFCCCAQLAK